MSLLIRHAAPATKSANQATALTTAYQGSSWVSGERAISVPRLHRLARFYKVPVDQLLPGGEDPDEAGRREVDHSGARIDLTRLEDVQRLVRTFVLPGLSPLDPEGRPVT